MKLQSYQYVYFLALCAAVTALPSDTVVPEVSLVETSMEASYNDAQATITNLMQQGKDDSACRDMAKTTADEVKASVDSQQKTLAAMANGDECNDEGQDLIDKANKDQLDADNAKSDAQTALTTAEKEKLNFGDFAYDDLQEGHCGTFFNTQTWKNAKSKVNAAQTTYDTKAAEATAAAKAVETAKSEAKILVKKCKCKAKKALDTALKTMNEDAKDANQKAWNKSYHMQCVLDGTTSKNCNVPSLPVVTAVPYGKGVKQACGCTAQDVFDGKKFCVAPGNSDSYISAGRGYNKPQYKLFGFKANNWRHATKGDARGQVEQTIWSCGDGDDAKNPQGYKQEFMLSRIFIGRNLPTADIWKRCMQSSTRTMIENGEGWRPLCDYNGGCSFGFQKIAMFPNKCPGHVYNGDFFGQIKHMRNLPDRRWKNMPFAGAHGGYANSLQNMAAMRTGGPGGNGYGISSYPTQSWTKPGGENSIMCILPLHGCAKGECGFV